jgi:GNAT superfamily N-acetyltransferase
MSGVDVRLLTKDDHDAWIPLWRGYQAFYDVDIPAAVSEVTFTRLLDPAEPMWGALAVADGRAVGMVHWLRHRSTWTVADNCYLQDLFAAPAAGGIGVGRLLIEHVYTAARALGCARVYWQTHETNSTAMRLYDRIADKPGFVIYRKALA